MALISGGCGPEGPGPGPMLLLLKIGLLFSPPEVGVADETPPWEALEVGGNPGGGYKGGRFEHISSH